MLNDTHTKSIIGSIYRAVYKNDLQLMLDLCAEYKTRTFDAVTVTRHKKSLNRLLAKAVREFKNDIALVLIELGADLNYFGAMALTTKQTQFFKPVKVTRPAEDQYPIVFEPDVLPTVQCYLLDLIVYFDNFELYNKIGADKFDLNIYQVSAYQHRNILNKRVNLSDYSVSQTFNNCMARRNAKNRFRHDLTIRMLWCSIFCNWLVKHHQYDTLRTLNAAALTGHNSLAVQWRKNVMSIYLQDRLFEICFFKPYDTAKVSAMYLNADLSNKISQRWLQRQYYCDYYLNFRLATLFAQLYLSNEIDRNCMLPIAAHNLESKPVAELVNYYYWQLTSITAGIVTLLPYAAFSFWFAYQQLQSDNLLFENYALFSASILILSYLLIETLRLLLALSARALSCGRIEALGSMDTLALRTYTTQMLTTTIQPYPAAPKTTSSCLTFLFKKTTAPGIELETIDVESQQPVVHNAVSHHSRFLVT